MTQKRSARLDLTPAGRMEEAGLQRVLGYQLAQAALVTDAIFFEQVGTPFNLRPVEYTVLTLIAENPGGSPAIATALPFACAGPGSASAGSAWATSAASVAAAGACTANCLSGSASSAACRASS